MAEGGDVKLGNWAHKADVIAACSERAALIDAMGAAMLDRPVRGGRMPAVEVESIAPRAGDEDGFAGS